jgi:hypothetical protein
MKFKLIFFIFNAIVVFSFLFISLLPVFMLGWDSAAPFWQQSWYLLILFLLILGGLDWYFISNWKFFTLLEKQNWDDVQAYLESRLFDHSRIGEQGLQILINIYVRKLDADKLISLAEILKEKKPTQFRRQRLNLGVGYLLKDDYAGLADFYSDIADRSELSDGGWADWFWAFASLKGGRQDDGLSRLRLIADQGKDEALMVLTFYMLSTIMDDESGASEHARGFIERFQKKHTPASWTSLIEKRQEQVYLRSLSAVLQQAGEALLKKTVAEQQPIAAPQAEPESDQEFEPRGEQHAEGSDHD